jgi:rubrerythrin
VVTDINGLLRDTLSRRRLLAMTGAGASAALLAGCADDTKNPTVKTAPDESDTADVELLNSMLDLEFATVAAYKAAAGKLSGPVLQIAKGFLEQEQEHADALTQAIKQLGGTPAKAKSPDEYAKGFPMLKSQTDVLKFAVDLENTAIAAYIDALPKLGKGDLRATAAAIVSNEAEHVAILLGALGEEQVPDAFVVGKAA